MVCSSRRVEVDPIPQEGAGMFSKVIRGEWCVFFLLSHAPLCWLFLAAAQLIKLTDCFICTGQVMHACSIPSNCPRPQMSSKLVPQTAFSYHSHSTKPNHGVIHRIRLQPHVPAFVRVELFPAAGGMPVASSGTFTDARSGAATTQVHLRAGHYIIEPRADGIPGVKGSFSLTVYSLCSVISLVPLT
jgi:hypothetical protein